MNMFSQIRDEDSSRPHNNPHARAAPFDIRNLVRLAADGYERIANDSVNEEHESFLRGLLDTLSSQAENAEINGVSQEFIDSLERVPKKMLKKTEMCPICAELFLNDEYPLVVRLPCHPSHKFDLECISPWLKLQGTCPLDRKALEKRVKVAPKDDDEDELAENDMYM
jgi:RING finger family protein